MARKPKYGDVYQMPNGALWMVIVPDGEPRTVFSTRDVQEYWQLPLTDDPDEDIKACEDTASGSVEVGAYVRE